VAFGHGHPLVEKEKKTAKKKNMVIILNNIKTQENESN
jgi:hypothetical protein